MGQGNEESQGETCGEAETPVPAFPHRPGFSKLKTNSNPPSE